MSIGRRAGGRAWCARRHQGSLKQSTSSSRLPTIVLGGDRDPGFAINTKRCATRGPRPCRPPASLPRRCARRLQRAIELDPEDADAYHERGLVRTALGKHGAAGEGFKQATRLAPDQPSVGGTGTSQLSPWDCDLGDDTELSGRRGRGRDVLILDYEPRPWRRSNRRSLRARPSSCG